MKEPEGARHTMRFSTVCLISILAVMAEPCRAQVSDTCMKSFVGPSADIAVEKLEKAKQETEPSIKDRGIRDARAFFSQRLNDTTTIWACAGGLDKKFAGILERRRIDKQVGAASGAAGSTSLVSGGSVPAPDRARGRIRRPHTGLRRHNRHVPHNPGEADRRPRERLRAQYPPTQRQHAGAPAASQPLGVVRYE